MATDPGRPFWAKGTTGPTFPNPFVSVYSTGDGSVGTESALSPNNNDRASRIPDVEPTKTAFHRGAIMEPAGARLTVSPSDKMPITSPEATIAGSVRVIRSQRGTNGNFAAGQDIGY